MNPTLLDNASDYLIDNTLLTSMLLILEDSRIDSRQWEKQ
jgi:hypothetical protein